MLLYILSRVTYTKESGDFHSFQPSHYLPHEAVRILRFTVYIVILPAVLTDRMQHKQGLPSSLHKQLIPAVYVRTVLRFTIFTLDCKAETYLQERCKCMYLKRDSLLIIHTTKGQHLPPTNHCYMVHRRRSTGYVNCI